MNRALSVLAAVIAATAIGCGGAGGESAAALDEAAAEGLAREALLGHLAEKKPAGRTIRAEVVAIDQAYVYNRFGSFNPAGMIYALKRDVVPIEPCKPLGPGNAMLREGKRPRPLVLRVNVGDTLRIDFTNLLAPAPVDADQPATRSASIHVNGLDAADIESLGGNVGSGPNGLAAPGETRTYRLLAEREGTFLMHSAGAMTGGEGLGGQIVQGLFGAVNVEPPGAVWYRSQVTAEELAEASFGQPNPDGTPRVDYDATDCGGVPILRILDDEDRIVHGDLNAIITGYASTSVGAPSAVDQGVFREMTVVFHDEVNAVQAFPELNERPFQGVRDGFGVNYGVAGLGAELLANRKKIGPTRNCVECKFEEFFLESWAGGDPALNVEQDENGVAVKALFPDDPSNVHHAYLGDPVRMRNLHAGPKETHVFHLHGHQWLQTPNGDKSTYLDSQSVGPGASYTYDLNYGGAGNRNLTPGDAIFHCHLYPHFAQGMWELLRVHDVFEAGTADRNLPDGEIAQGTPTPAIVPLPERAMPPMPTPAFRGYPFYIGAIAGHRPSQPPLDIEFDGGLPRHVVTSVPPGGAVFGQRGLFDVQIQKANVKLLPAVGTPAEKAAMDFHAGLFPGAQPFTTLYGVQARSYPAFTPEGAPARFVVNGRGPKPGAPYADPCPAGAPKRTYRAAYVQINGVVNEAGWHDKQMRLTVLEQDVLATQSGARPPEPLFVRANSNDCVVFKVTNLFPDALEADDFQVFTPTDVVGQHIHLVKFDVTSSDGAGNGWNYEDGTLASAAVTELINAANAQGGAFPADGALTPTGPRVALTAKVNPQIPFAPLGAQTTIQRWWADPLLDAAGRDRTLRTAFTHDHFAPSSHQQHGLYAALVVEPNGSTWRDPSTGQVFGARADGGPTSFRADILTAAPSDSYREFNLAIADFAILYDALDKPVNPPNFAEVPLPVAVAHVGVPVPEVISVADPGTGLVNYRNEPLPLRLAKRNADGTFALKAGPEGEVRNAFRSGIHGDPFTPILPIYERDKIQVRLTQGAQEEQHVFTVHGQRWLHEPSDPDSGYRDDQALGISEHFELVMQSLFTSTKNADGSVDHLYASTPTDDLWNGMWGILRAYGKKIPGLLPLPNNTPPVKLAEPTSVCPKHAPVRAYEVHAITAQGNLPGGRLTYNNVSSLYDPEAILFVRKPHLDAVRSGARKPEPLLLRAAAGDCIKVTLVNELPASPPQTPHWNYNPPITEEFNTNQVPISGYVSLHPQLVTYDVNTGDGAAIGQNQDQLVPPGGQRTYTWYAGEIVAGPSGLRYVPVEYGAVNLKDMADVVGHGVHGAVGALVIEPEGATWSVDPDLTAQATVTWWDGEGKARSFREHVIVTQDEIGMRSDDPRFRCQDQQLNCGNAIRNIGGADDAEETGHKAFNYRTEPIWARLGLPPETPQNVINAQDLTSILRSAGYGDPATPIFTAARGEEQRFRLVQPSGHTRQHAFTPWGAAWPNNPFAAGSRSRVMGPNPQNFVRGVEDRGSAMTTGNLIPYQPAGGKRGVTGDFLYRDHASFGFTQGLWGIVRVTK